MPGAGSWRCVRLFDRDRRRLGPRLPHPHARRTVRSYLAAAGYTAEGLLQTSSSAALEPEPITQILTHIGEPTSPPLIHLARGPPQTELDMGHEGSDTGELNQDSLPVDFNQTADSGPADPEPAPPR